MGNRQLDQYIKDAENQKHLDDTSRVTGTVDELWTIEPAGTEITQDVDFAAAIGGTDIVLVMPLRLNGTMMEVKEVIFAATVTVKATMGIYILLEPIPAELKLNGSLKLGLIPDSEQIIYPYLNGTNSMARAEYKQPIILDANQRYFLAIMGPALHTVVSRFDDSLPAFRVLSNLKTAYSTRPSAVNNALPPRLETSSSWSMPVAVLRSELGMVLYGMHRP